jgi:putative ABC transport system permease protein
MLISQLAQAAQAIKDNRLRTILSVLGVSVGITAVIIVGAISKGGRHVIFSELETFGLKSIWISRKKDVNDPNRAIRKGTGIDNNDYEAINANCCSAVIRVTPIVRAGKHPIVRTGANYSPASVYGVGEQYIKINNDRIERGREIREEDLTGKRFIAVIGKEVEKNLFDKRESAVGKYIQIDTAKYLVVGVIKEKSRDFLASIGSAGGQDANARILLPATTYQLVLGKKNEISWLQLESKSLNQTEAAISQVTRLLERRHRGRFSYKSESMAQHVETANRILNMVSMIGIVAASVSLLVGGMGIMNIMSTSVLERTKEIGLRKAIGAKKRDILTQFLLESILISGIGGALGLAIGLSVSFILAAVTGYPLVPSWIVVVSGVIVSVVVGLISGYYPALRAAKMQPVVALRYE